MTDLTAEIDAAVRRDRMLAQTRKYGPVLGVVVLAVLLASGGLAIWRERHESDLARANMALISTIEKLTPDTHADTIKALSTEIQGDAKPIAWVGRLYEAGLLRDGGKFTEAEVSYQAIADDATPPQVYRDLARLSVAETRMNRPEIKPDNIRPLLTPLAAPEQVWRNLAREDLAVLALRTGDRAAAAQWLEAVVQDTLTAPSQKQRATEALAALKLQP